MLVITKIEDPEELDTRFSKFSPAHEEESLLDSFASELLEGADGLLNLLQDPSETKTAQPDSSKKEESSETQNGFRIFTFQKLDVISEAARAAGGQFSGESILYKKPEEGPYFLVLKKPSDSKDFSRVCNTLAVYGTEIRHDYATESYYAEHYDVIIRENAVQILAGL